MQGDANQSRAVQPIAYRIGDLYMDLERSRVTRGDAEIPLSALSFEFLRALARAAPKLVTFDDLMEAAWPGLVVSPETLTQRVKILRAALGDDPKSPRYIAGVRGRGYRAIEATPVYAAAISTSYAPQLEDAVPSVPGRSHEIIPAQRRIVIRGGITALMMISLLSGSAAVAPMLGSFATSDGRTLTLTPARMERAVAVIPFANLSGDTQLDYISDGLTDELINRLSRVQGLRVAARTSSFHFKEHNATAQQVARTLGVRHLLEGSIKTSAERIRISAQLVDAQTGFTLWSKTFERSRAQLLTVRDEIAMAVVDEMAVTLREHAYAALSRGVPLRPEALDSFLRARHLAMSFERDRGDKAISHYEQAIRMDPEFAEAYVGLADALLNQMQIAEMGTDPVMSKRIGTLLATAAELDPHSGDPHALLSQLRMLEFDFPGAAREAEIALALTPNSGYVLLYATQFYAFISSAPEKAIELALRGRRLDPLNAWAASQVVIAYMHAHQYEPALQAIEEVCEIDPDLWIAYALRAHVLDALGRYDEALLAAQRAVELNEVVDTLMFLGIAHARVGHRSEARAILEKLTAARAQVYWPPTQEAMLRCALDDWNAALDALERAYAERDWWLPQALHFHYFAALYEHPRFAQLARRLEQENRVQRAQHAHQKQ